MARGGPPPFMVGAKNPKGDAVAAGRGPAGNPFVASKTAGGKAPPFGKGKKRKGKKKAPPFGRKY